MTDPKAGDPATPKRRLNYDNQHTYVFQFNDENTTGLSFATPTNTAISTSASASSTNTPMETTTED